MNHNGFNLSIKRFHLGLFSERIHRYSARMTDAALSEVEAIQKRVADAGLVMAHVLKKADVAKATWWRIKKGREHFTSTIERINAAITDMVANPESVPRRRKPAPSKTTQGT